MEDVLVEDQSQISESSLHSNCQTSNGRTVCGDGAFVILVMSRSNKTESTVFIKREHKDRGEQSSRDGRMPNEMSTTIMSLDTAPETTQLQAGTTTLSEPGDSQGIDDDGSSDSNAGSPSIIESVGRIQVRKSQDVALWSVERYRNTVIITRAYLKLKPTWI
jgi:hypothetical protein